MKALLLFTVGVLAACSGPELRQHEPAKGGGPASFDAAIADSVETGMSSSGPDGGTMGGQDEATNTAGGVGVLESTTRSETAMGSSAAPLDATRDLETPLDPAGSATPETSCITDADCHIFNEDCGSYCGVCPESGQAVNAFGVRKLRRECRRDRRQWKKHHKRSKREHIRCGACLGGFSDSECRLGVCTKVLGRKTKRPFEDDPVAALSKQAGAAPLSTEQVKRGMLTARARLLSCSREHAAGEKSRATIARIEIEPDGTVGSVSVATKNRELRACARLVIMSLEFPKAERRTRVSWPLR